MVMMDGIDLEHLTEAERDAILSVIQRDDQLKRKEQERVKNLEKEVKQIRVKGVIKQGSDPDRTCARCREPFSKKGANCPKCKHKICENCRENVANGHWLCVLCFKQMEVEAQSGGWFYNKFRKSKRSKKTNKPVLGSDLVKASMIKEEDGPTANKRDPDNAKRVLSNNNAEGRGSFDEEDSDTQSALGDGPSSRVSDGDGVVYPKESDRHKLEQLMKGSTAKKVSESQNGSVQIRRVSSNRYQDSGSSDEEDARAYTNRHSGLELPDSRNSSVRSSVVSSEGRITMVTESNISDIETLSAHSNEDAAVFAAAATITASMATSEPFQENQSPDSVLESTSYSSPNESEWNSDCINTPHVHKHKLVAGSQLNSDFYNSGGGGSGSSGGGEDYGGSGNDETDYDTFKKVTVQKQSHVSPVQLDEFVIVRGNLRDDHHPIAADDAIATTVQSGDLNHKQDTMSRDQHGGCIGGVTTNTPLLLHVNSKPLCHSSPLASPSDLSDSSSAAGHLLKTDLQQNNNIVLCRLDGESESKSVSNTTSLTHNKSELTTNTPLKPKMQNLDLSEGYVVIDSDLEGESKDWSSSDLDEDDVVPTSLQKNGPLTLDSLKDRKTQYFDNKSNRSQSTMSKLISHSDSSEVSITSPTNTTKEISEISSESKILVAHDTVIQPPRNNSNECLPHYDKPLSIRDKVDMLLSKYSWAGEGERSGEESHGASGVNRLGDDSNFQNTHIYSSVPKNLENVPSTGSVPLKESGGDSGDGLVLSSGYGDGCTKECQENETQVNGAQGYVNHSGLDVGSGDTKSSALQHGKNGQEVKTWDHNAKPLSSHNKLNDHNSNKLSNSVSDNVLTSVTETHLGDNDIDAKKDDAENYAKKDDENNDEIDDDRHSGSSSPASDYTDLYGGLIDLEWDGEPLHASVMTKEQRAEIVSQLKASMAFSSNLRDFDDNDPSLPGYSSYYGGVNQEGDFLDDDLEETKYYGNAQTKSGSRAGRYRQVVVPDDLCSDSLSIIAELSEPDEDEFPSIFIPHLHSSESEEETASSNDLHKTETMNEYENGDKQDQDIISTEGESAHMDNNEIDIDIDLKNDINEEKIDNYLTVISEKESESDNEKEEIKPKKTLGSAVAANSDVWKAAENDKKSNEAYTDFVEADRKDSERDNTKDTPVKVINIDRTDDQKVNGETGTEDVAAIVAATVTVAESEPTPKQSTPKKGKYPLEKADSLSNMIDEQDLNGDEDKDFAAIFENNKDYAGDSEVKLEEIENENNVKVLIGKVDNENENQKEPVRPVLVVGVLQPDDNQETPNGASLEDVDESHLSPIAELQKKFDNPPNYYFPVVANKVSDESNETEENIKKEIESKNRAEEERSETSKAVPIADWMAKKSQDKKEFKEYSELEEIVEHEDDVIEEIDDSINMQMPDFAIDEEEKEPIDSLLMEGEFTQRPLPVTDLDEDSPVEGTNHSMLNYRDNMSVDSLEGFLSDHVEGVEERGRDALGKYIDSGRQLQRIPWEKSEADTLSIEGRLSLSSVDPTSSRSSFRSSNTDWSLTSTGHSVSANEGDRQSWERYHSRGKALTNGREELNHDDSPSAGHSDESVENDREDQEFLELFDAVCSALGYSSATETIHSEGEGLFCQSRANDEYSDIDIPKTKSKLHQRVNANVEAHILNVENQSHDTSLEIIKPKKKLGQAMTSAAYKMAPGYHSPSSMNRSYDNFSHEVEFDHAINTNQDVMRPKKVAPPKPPRQRNSLSNIYQNVGSDTDPSDNRELQYESKSDSKNNDINMVKGNKTRIDDIDLTSSVESSRVEVMGQLSSKEIDSFDITLDPCETSHQRTNISKSQEQELTPNGVDVPAEYQDEIDHADKKEENHIQEEKKEGKKDDNDNDNENNKTDAIKEIGSEKEKENVEVEDLKEKTDEDDLKTAAAIATATTITAADQTDSKPATPKTERTESKASDTSVPSISVTQPQSPSEDSIEPTEEGDNIDELFASHSSMNQSQTTDSQSLNKSNLLSPLSESKESITSFYSDAGEGNYGKIPVTGELQMALEYNYQSALFEIKVKQCKDIAPVDTKKKRSDPYVKSYLLPDRTKSGKRKTRVKKNTLNPIYDETIKYHIIKSELESRTLWVSVWHRDTFGRNAFLGEVNIPLDFYHFENVEPKWYKLMERMSRFAIPFDEESFQSNSLRKIVTKNSHLKSVALGDKEISVVSTNPGGKGKKSKGKKVLYSSTPNLSTGGMSMVVYKGDLKLSLKYVTPDNVDRKRAKKSDNGEIHCLVKEARNLTAVRANGYSDPFCKAYLLPDKSKKSKQKSQCIKKNCNPEWNHEFIFDDVSLDDLKDRSLELTVWDHGAMSNDFLGGSRLNLGTGKLDQTQTEVDWLDAKGEEVTVWQSMINTPNTWVQGNLMLRANMDSKK